MCTCTSIHLSLSLSLYIYIYIYIYTRICVLQGPDQPVGGGFVQAGGGIRADKVLPTTTTTTTTTTTITTTTTTTTTTTKVLPEDGAQHALGAFAPLRRQVLAVVMATGSSISLTNKQQVLLLLVVLL